VLEGAEEPKEIACGESSVIVRLDRFAPQDEQPEPAGHEEIYDEGQLLCFFQHSRAVELAARRQAEPLALIAPPPLYRPQATFLSAG